MPRRYSLNPTPPAKHGRSDSPAKGRRQVNTDPDRYQRKNSRDLSNYEKQVGGNPVTPHRDRSKEDPTFTPEDRAARDTGKGSKSQTSAKQRPGARASETRKEKSARVPSSRQQSSGKSSANRRAAK